MELAKLFVTLALDAKQFTQGINEAKSAASDFAKGAAGWLGSGIKTAVNVGAAALAGLGVATIGAGAALLGLGSDAQEMQSKFNVVFANVGGEVTAQLDSFAAAAGRSKYELREMAATFGDTLKPMGFTEEAAGEMSVTLSQLAVDLGSFNNMPMDEALRRLQGTLIGSHENALAFGVIINENTLQAELAANGWDKLTGAELEQAKVQARINLLIKGTTDAQGDAIRTAAGWANQTRALTSKIKDFATGLGMKLLPVVEPLLAKITELAGQAMPWLSAAFDNILPIIETISTSIINFITNLQNGMTPMAAIKTLIWEMFPEPVATSILNIVDTVQNLVRAFENLFVAQSFFEDDPAWLIALRNAGDAIRPFIQSIIEAIANFVSWKDVLIAVGIAIGAVLIPVIWGILSPILAVIAAVAAISLAVAAVRQIWENDWLGIRTAVQNAWEGFIKPAFDAIAAFISEVLIPKAQELWDKFVNVWWPAISAAVQNAWENVIKPALQALWDFLTNTVIPKVQELWDKFVNVWWPAISTAVQQAWESVIKPALQALWDFLTNTVIPKVQELWQKWTEDWWPAISTALENAWTIIKTIWEELGRWINDNIMPWVETLQETWETGWAAIHAALTTAWGVIEPVWTTIQTWLQDNLPTAVEGVRSVWESAMTTMSSVIEPVRAAIDGIKSAAESFWNWISSHVFSFEFNLPDLPDWAIPGSPLPIHTAWANFAQAMPTMWDKLADPLASVTANAIGAPMPEPALITANGGSQQNFNYYNYGSQPADPVDWMRKREGLARIK